MSGTPPKTVARSVLRELGELTVSTYRVSKGFNPLIKLLAREADVTQPELHACINTAFEALYRHPLLRSSERVTAYLRQRGVIPNEQSTEELIRYVIDQLVARSPVPVPEAIVTEFWHFFDELFASNELKGLGELTLDMVRLVVEAYEPLLVEIFNLLKASRRFNDWQMRELGQRAAMIRADAVIVRRQIRALRHIKPFFQADAKDFKKQAQIVAQMVREFGPFFIKMAQVAAANADFLPEEIARELAVFHEDVAPMSEAEVDEAFLECFGKRPHQMYMDFDASRPLKSGSIGSVYLVKKPVMEGGREVLKSVVIKVGRHRLDREFATGKLVLGLAILSSQYWAPHSKLTPFLRAMQGQVDEFVAGFMDELDFEREARNQQRFFQRAQNGSDWRVPELYGYSPRILEMEYLGAASSLPRALQGVGRAQRREFQKRVSQRLLRSVLSQMLLYGEVHGDLHPGNIMVGPDGALSLIDWGNVVPLDGKWNAVRDYLSAALLADTAKLADALIAMSTEPQAGRERRDAIKAMLDDTLNRKQITRLTPRGAVAELRADGMKGLQRRLQLAAHLTANTHQAGLVLQRDYLHLSRAVFAAVGSFGSLYEGESKRALFTDIGFALARLPLKLAREHLRSRKLGRQRLAQYESQLLLAPELPEKRAASLSTFH